MRKIMSQKPDKSVQLTGRHDFEKILLKLRREQYALIDLQRHDASFSSVWYGKGTSVLGQGRACDDYVTMLVWELEEPGPSTTVLTWRV